MSSSASIKVRFLIEKEEKRVVYVEAGSDFVDVLFSFLTLPLGAIVRLLKKRSGLGSLDSLYESIEQLDSQHLQTEACGCIQNLYSSVENIGLEYFKSEICRNMLLTPKLTAFFGYKNQLISIKVRFLIDKEEKRVVYVEAGSDFVDVLFSFLTLPLGAIVRLLKKRSGLGSLDSLYESIEQLDAEHLQTEACKEMLLNPRSAAARLCEDLKVKGIHELKPRSFYTCRQDGCLIRSICCFTYTSNVLCSRCGELMDRIWEWKKTTEEGGVFVKATTEFMITDDLRVMPSSLLKSLSLLKEMHIKDTSMLEERVMQFGTKEVSHLS
ncbi:hypothetical protein KSP39_PZI022656 [Platanthera zijinensis]|uniref:DUF674 family protein n=1 Tax=Platanthera zijinensis TaxID=2320716 RepID=A0AAP0AWB7_9ASPA